MPKAAPRFWQAGVASPLPALLRPLAAIYGFGNRLNQRITAAQEIGVPVLSIGNLVAGGAGKTPTAIAIAQRLLALGRHPQIVSRGYGGRLTGPVRVDLNRHHAADVGDEALLLALAAPTWIGSNRPAAARAAVAAGADCIIADDAHQTYALARRLSLLVVDGGYGFGNGLQLPAGPLREPIEDGLARCDALVVIGPRTVALPDFGRRPVFNATLEPNAADAVRLRGRRVLAFAGIGRPEKFFTSLQQLGATVVQTATFPDHAPYSPDTVMRLVETAHGLSAIPVTTAKDQVRLPAAARAMVDVLRVSLAFAEPQLLDTYLQKMLPPAQKQAHSRA
ncbi:MAG: tetraacyldisaccharide 4'-kinase [Ferrovibrio sp.]|uniref:tetraacyldisaccharide 4'-kinase n=1 Tax=Ferrovibrio sp. TaxID=1917215 RepID=UPI00261690F5|nr:tetraacyldisaccharide 4'-kinase [Ferrovibrio sp.]MCW0232848.1 tetraacyldisaccharide 4'-kinase [Ferrovibrio sp.]